MGHQNIVFFDGVCNLCNGFVDFIVSTDRRGRIHVASLQGSTAEILVPSERRMAKHRNENESDLESVVYFKAGAFYYKSEAVARVLCDLPLPISWLGHLLLLIPARWRDAGYSWVARHRYKLFGRRDTCRLPKPDERDRFLP